MKAQAGHRVVYFKKKVYPKPRQGLREDTRPCFGPGLSSQEHRSLINTRWPQRAPTAPMVSRLTPSSSCLFPPPFPALFPFLKNTEKWDSEAYTACEVWFSLPKRGNASMRVLIATPAPPHTASLCPYGEIRIALTQLSSGILGPGWNG